MKSTAGLIRKDLARLQMQSNRLPFVSPLSTSCRRRSLTNHFRSHPPTLCRGSYSVLRRLFAAKGSSERELAAKESERELSTMERIHLPDSEKHKDQTDTVESGTFLPGYPAAAERKEEDGPKKKRVPWFKITMVLLSPLFFYIYKKRQAKTALLKDIKLSVVPANPPEIRKLMYDARLETQDLVLLMRYMKKHFPEGCNLDTFGDILKEVVDKKREANKVLSELELAVQAEKARLELAATMKGNSEEVLGDDEEWEEVEVDGDAGGAGEGGAGGVAQQEEEEEEDELEPTLENWDDQKMKSFRAYDALPLFRHQGAEEVVDLPTLLTAAAIFAQDFKHEDFLLGEKNGKDFGQARRRKINRNPFYKLQFAFWVALQSRKTQTAESSLTFGEFEGLMDRLLRTGHIDSETLLSQTQYWPVRFSVKTPKQLTEEVYADLTKQPNDRISFDEFKRVVASRSVARECEFWYIEPAINTGFGQRWSNFLRETLRKKLHTADYLGKPLFYMPAPELMAINRPPAVVKPTDTESDFDLAKFKNDEHKKWHRTRGYYQYTQLDFAFAPVPKSKRLISARGHKSI